MKRPYKYRYRNDRSTRQCRDRFDKIARLGTILYVKGYRYHGRYDTDHEAVLVVGTEGSARFGGLLWGYQGEGPRGTRELLILLGLSANQSEDIAYYTPRLFEVGEDWRYTFSTPVSMAA